MPLMPNRLRLLACWILPPSGMLVLGRRAAVYGAPKIWSVIWESRLSSARSTMGDWVCQVADVLRPITDSALSLLPVPREIEQRPANPGERPGDELRGEAAFLVERGLPECREFRQTRPRDAHADGDGRAPHRCF